MMSITACIGAALASTTLGAVLGWFIGGALDGPHNVWPRAPLGAVVGAGVGLVVGVIAIGVNYAW